MVKRKIDNRIRILIENGFSTGHRTLLILVGEKSRDQVVYLHHILSKTSLKQASVLWCYKNKLVFSSNRRKRIKQLKAKQQYGNADVNEDDPFEMFISMTDIRYCYYKDTHKILGNTFKMCVIQDFEALTPNILCRTVETIEGGGVIVLLLESITSLKQLYTLNMDVHSRYRTAAHQNLVPRFNERFILSLTSCPNCIVLNDELQILPISSLTREIEALPFSHTDKMISKNEGELDSLKETNKEVLPLGTLMALCKTLDQAKIVAQFMAAIVEKTLATTVTLTAARGRGKSAAMGLALAGAVYVGYANMYMTSPSPENLNTLIEFLLKGLDALGYEKHIHYDTLISSDPEHNKAVMRITIKKEHRQIVQYISPHDCKVLDNAELVIIDEAAAIPLPQVKALFGPYLVFLASTISGYEGTGRSLSLKLIKQLRENINLDEFNYGAKYKKKLLELSLNEPIRYHEGDHVEKWLYDLLCLETSSSALADPLPSPNDCELFYVNKDMLFSYHKVTEKFLKTIMHLLVSSHYRNTPNDLQLLSDAPSHNIFVLLPANSSGDDRIPNVFCVVQVALEGKISKQLISGESSKNTPGDIIPWTVSNLFQDDDFPQLSGARIVRIATHPELQGRGYGSRAMELLENYYNKSAHKATIEDIPMNEPVTTTLDEEENNEQTGELVPKTMTQPLLLSTKEREAEPLHYLGVSFGASLQLSKFWKKLGFTCIYLSQVRNELTGEYTTLLLKVLLEDKSARLDSWLRPLWYDFQKRLISLLCGSFRSLDSQFAISLATNGYYRKKARAPPLSHLKLYISYTDIDRLDAYTRNQCEYFSVCDILPRVALLYFHRKMPNFKLKAIQMAIFLAIGIQRKHPAKLAKEFDFKTSVMMTQVHSLIVDLVRSLKYLWELCENGGLETGTETGLLDQNLDQIVKEVTEEVSAEIEENLKRKVDEEDGDKLADRLDLTGYAVRGIESEVDMPKPKKKKISLEESRR